MAGRLQTALPRNANRVLDLLPNRGGTSFAWILLIGQEDSVTHQHTHHAIPSPTSLHLWFQPQTKGAMITPRNVFNFFVGMD